MKPKLVKKTTHADEEKANYDLKRMKSAVESKPHTLPTGLSREEKRQYILSHS